MQWQRYVTDCDCRCHHASRVSNPPSVGVDDVIAAALACDACRPVHCPALRSTQLANAPEPIVPSPAEFCAWVDGEGAE